MSLKTVEQYSKK